MVLYAYPGLCFLTPCAAWMYHKKDEFRRLHHIGVHVALSFVFIFYCFCAMVPTAGIGTIWDLLQTGRLSLTMNTEPLLDPWSMQNALNIIMFMPLGFLLPLIWRDYQSLRKVLPVGFGLSLLIETCQMLNVRTTDIDDLIMNTIGASVGYLCWRLFAWVFPQASGKTAPLSKAEPLIYIFAGAAGVVLFFDWRFVCQ